MAVGVVVVIIIIAAALVLGSLIARRRQLQHARMAQVLGPEPVALEAVNTGGGTGSTYSTLCFSTCTNRWS